MCAYYTPKDEKNNEDRNNTHGYSSFIVCVEEAQSKEGGKESQYSRRAVENSEIRIYVIPKATYPHKSKEYGRLYIIARTLLPSPVKKWKFSSTYS